MADEIDDLNVTDASNTTRFPEGQAPSTVNNGARALEGMLARGFKDTIDGVVTTGGTSTAYTVTSKRTSLPAAYYAGLLQAVDWHTASGATPTINISSIGAKALIWPAGTAVTTNDLPAGGQSLVSYDSSADKFQVI